MATRSLLTSSPRFIEPLVSSQELLLATRRRGETPRPSVGEVGRYGAVVRCSTGLWFLHASWFDAVLAIASVPV